MPLSASRRFPIISLIVCLVAILVLCALGVWQLNRLHWKNNLQQNLDAAFAEKDPAPFTAEQFQPLQKGDVIRGSAYGALDLSKAVFFHGRIQDGKSVMAVVAPMTIPSLNMTVIVELGCGDHPKMQDITKEPNKQGSITGILRQPKWSFATPANIPEKGEWWRIDSRELGAYWGVHNLKTGVITAENTSDLAPSFSPCPIERQLRNDHASYAFFWFTMGFVLCVIWGLRFLKPYLQSA